MFWSRNCILIGVALIWRAMWRLLALIWLALSLAFASGPAFAMSAADCPMAESASSSTMHHDDNGCCKPVCGANCVTACPSMVAPSHDRAAAPAKPVANRLIAALSTPLHSIALKGADPPPRTIFI